MPNRQLNESEQVLASELINEIRFRLVSLAGDDQALLFAYRRKVYKELSYDERGTPMHRRKLKQLKRIEQQGVCPVCEECLPEKYTVLDRYNAADGYTKENTRLIHKECDSYIQQSRGYK